jgi:transcription elongation GreA/GreB family factor
MSRAFTKDDDTGSAIAEIGERPVSQHRNLVTAEGLKAIDAELASLRAELARAEAEHDRERIALLSRDLRYWNARRENAELSEPDPKSKVVRFGMAVTIEDADGKQKKWKIVGEDEADAAHGKISHSSPMAAALFGKKVGATAKVSGKEWEIVAISTVG